MKRDGMIRGAIDMHVHSHPDIAPRSVNDIELARAATEAGMRGFILKCHIGSTAERAYLVEQVVPHIRVFGSLTLNYTAGGLNPHGVDACVRLGAKEVWMPTLSSQHMFTFLRANVPLEERITFDEARRRIAPPPSLNCQPGDPWPWSRNGGGISLMDENGKLLKEVRMILEILAPRDVILGTGHISIPETHALIDAAREIGVKRILVTHPEYMPTMSLEDQISFARRGVYFERCYVSEDKPSKRVGGPFPFDVIVKNIRAAGVGSTVLGTDYGQAGKTHPVEVMKIYFQKLHEAGFRDGEIEQMAVKTPAALLGL